MLWLGLYPKPMLDRIKPSVDHLIAHVEQHSNYHQPGVAVHGFDQAADSATHEEGTK
jgi:hypothetical protein